MITRKELYGGILIVLAAIAGASYFNMRLNVARYEQVKADMAPIHQKAAEEKKSAARAEDTNQKALKKALAKTDELKRQPISTEVDYERVREMIAERMRTTKVEVTANPQAPDAPSATLPARNLRDYMADCDATSVALNSCRDSLRNLNVSLNAEKSDHEASKRELAAARTAMKGGGFWQRFKGNTKWFAIGAAAGGATAAILKH